MTDIYEGVSLTDLSKLLKECELELVQSFTSYVLLDHNGIEVYNSKELTDIYTYAVGYLIDIVGKDGD